ncbi:hypothetical protein TrST_g202 [Triparma strigata]|uniref:Uncharacterized protein n=1 Tax=Triparma strigata TaxID=1606541 RepID=A0A9W7E5C3_9STRA|nr:hypothetical protein TrST_g202 [Triparma strigata]
MAKIAISDTSELLMGKSMDESVSLRYMLLLQEQEEIEARVAELEAEYFGGMGRSTDIPEQRRIANTLSKLQVAQTEDDVKEELKYYNESSSQLQKQVEYDELCMLGGNLQRWLERREAQDTQKVKVSYERGRERLRENIMDVVDSVIELTNEFGSAFFIFSVLWKLDNQILFQVSVCFLFINLVARLLIGLRNYPHVDDGTVIRATLETGYVEKTFRIGSSKKPTFFLALLLFVIEPSSGRKLIKETLRKTQTAKNADGTTHDLHPVALKKLGLYLSARNEVQTSLAITLFADLPELAIELLYILAFSTGENADFSFWFSIAGTIAHLARQGIELQYDARYLPELLHSSKHVDVTFQKDTTGEEVEVWAAKNGAECRVLTLTNCKAVGDKAAGEIATYCGKLEKLSAADTSIGNEGATAIAKSSPGLQKCFVNGTNVDDDGAAIIAKHCKDLKMFALSRTEFSDKGAQSVATFCKGLNVLGINTSELTDEGCKLIAEGCKKLHTFKLADTKVGDEGVRKAVKGLPGLKTLHLFSNQQLTDACCEDIGRLEFLKELHLAKTNIGNAGIRLLLKENTSIERLFIGGANVTIGGFIDAVRDWPGNLTKLDVGSLLVMEDEKRKLGLKFSGCEIIMEAV